MTESSSTSFQYARYPSLAGRHAFVSGGASGIGADLVSHLADQGAKVTFVDIDTERGEKHAAALRAGGAEVTFRPCDITDIPLLQQTIADAAEEYGPIRVLVNNAANDVRTPFDQVDVEQWDREIAVNVRHHFFAAQAVAPMMREAGGGSIINFGSITAHVDVPNLTGYVTAKAGIEGLTRAQAKEYGRWEIRVNCIIPGWILTEKQLTEHATPEALDKLLNEDQKLPHRLYGEDVARMMLWLAADDSRSCTGHEYVVDGGWW
jgi:NAD(P)-dependent dehydrogenase (short-subunit alcohol dehydrogenase family)